MILMSVWNTVFQAKEVESKSSGMLKHLEFVGSTHKARFLEESASQTVPTGTWELNGVTMGQCSAR